MRTLKIQVNNDKDYHRLKAFLKTIHLVKNKGKAKRKTADAITLISEDSLAEEWLSPEDERYELYFKK